MVYKKGEIYLSVTLFFRHNFEVITFHCCEEQLGENCLISPILHNCVKCTNYFTAK